MTVQLKQTARLGLFKSYKNNSTLPWLEVHNGHHLSSLRVWIVQGKQHKQERFTAVSKMKESKLSSLNSLVYRKNDRLLLTVCIRTGRSCYSSFVLRKSLGSSVGITPLFFYYLWLTCKTLKNKNRDAVNLWDDSHLRPIRILRHRILCFKGYCSRPSSPLIRLV